MIDLAPWPIAGSFHDAFAKRDVLQYLVDLTGGEKGGCVQRSYYSGMAFM